MFRKRSKAHRHILFILQNIQRRDLIAICWWVGGWGGGGGGGGGVGVGVGVGVWGWWGCGVWGCGGGVWGGGGGVGGGGGDGGYLSLGG